MEALLSNLFLCTVKVMLTVCSYCRQTQGCMLVLVFRRPSTCFLSILTIYAAIGGYNQRRLTSISSRTFM